MTENRKFKQAVRARMAKTGECYSVAARKMREEDRINRPPSADGHHDEDDR